MSERLGYHRLLHAVFEHGRSRVVPEDVRPLPFPGRLPYPCHPENFCHDVLYAVVCKRGERPCFGEEQPPAFRIRAFLRQVIKNGIPNDRGEREFQRKACLLLADADRCGFPVDGIQGEACNVAAPDPCKDEEQHDGPVAHREGLLFNCRAHCAYFLLCEVLYVPAPFL